MGVSPMVVDSIAKTKGIEEIDLKIKKVSRNYLKK
jgi:hypothetical protein